VPWILLTVIVGAAVLGGLLALCHRVMLHATARAIEVRHRMIEWITETRQAPEAWTRRARRPRSAKRRCLRRLADLIAYARTSPVIADDSTRETLVHALEAVRDEWEEKDATAFVNRDAPRE